MRHSTPFAAIAILSIAGLAHAEPDGGATPNETTQKEQHRQDHDETQALRGPEIYQSSRAPEDAEHRGEHKPRGRMSDEEGQRIHPVRELMGALRALRTAEGELKLTDEQEEQIKAIMDEHREAMDAYRKEHREEIDALQAVMRTPRGMTPPPLPPERLPDPAPEGEEGMNPPPPPPPPAPAGEDGMDDVGPRQVAAMRLRELIDSAPANGESRKKVMGVLTPAQRELVRTTVREQRKRIAETGDRIRERRQDRQRGERKDASNRRERVEPLRGPRPSREDGAGGDRPEPGSRRSRPDGDD